MSNAASYQSIPDTHGTATQTAVNSLAAGLTLLGFSAYMQSLAGTVSKAAMRAALGIDTGDVGAIWGLTYAKNGANTLDVAVGGAMADDGVTWLGGENGLHKAHIDRLQLIDLADFVCSAHSELHEHQEHSIHRRERRRL